MFSGYTRYYDFRDAQASATTAWVAGAHVVSVGGLVGGLGSYLQDGPPALGCMLAAGWAAPGHPMQGHVAVSAHTVGAVVVIDKAGPELRALPTNHLGWQVGKTA